MAEIDISHLRDLLSRTIGPAPWYWKTFPALITSSGRRFSWTHHGDQGSLAYLVSLHTDELPESPRLALNTFCRPFSIPEDPASSDRLGIWCPEGRSLRVLCFDPAQLQAFDFAEIAGWFKQSAERIYAATPPLGELEIPLTLGAGTHKIDVPSEFRTVEELMMPASFPARSSDDPAFALYVLYPHAGLVEVLPQKWFTAAQYEVGRQWITRAGRDPESHRIFGECFGVGTFLLEDDGIRLDRWLAKTSS